MNETELFHLGFDYKKYTAKYAIIPGAPERVPKIAEHFAEATAVCQNREYNTYLARTESGEGVFVCSTGIGGPSTAIAVHELHQAGVQTFIRVGTCGGIKLDVKGGDIVIATASVRQEGTALHYAPIEYPAAASFEVVSALARSAEKLSVEHHIGVIQCKDSFYGQHSPESMPVSAELLEKWEAWKRLGVLCSEMESATLFTVAAALGCRAGTVLHAIWNQERAKAGLSNDAVYDTENAIKCAVGAINLLSASEK